MKSIKLIFITFFSLTAVISTLQAYDKPLIMTDERPPFEFADANGNIDGVAAKVVHCVLKKMDQSYEMKIVPWKRAQVNTEKGKADAFFAASKNAKRDKYAALSDFIVDQYWNWYLLKDSSFDPSSASFKNQAKVVSWYGSNSSKWLENNGYKTKGAPKTTEQMVKMLEKGRVDAIFGSNFAIEIAIEEQGLKEKVKIVKGLYKPMGIYFSKIYLGKNKGFLETFNSKIAQCK